MTLAKGLLFAALVFDTAVWVLDQDPDGHVRRHKVEAGVPYDPDMVRQKILPQKPCLLRPQDATAPGDRSSNEWKR